MKRWIKITIAVISVAVFGVLLAKHYSDRALQARNVRHDVQRFMMSLKLGNERAAANFLARPNMDSGAFDQALRAQARSLLSTNFETAPLQFRGEGPLLLATFSCADGAKLTFASADDGEMWRFYEIKAQ
jgi:hypothetical protein